MDDHTVPDSTSQNASEQPARAGSETPRQSEGAEDAGLQGAEVLVEDAKTIANAAITTDVEPAASDIRPLSLDPNGNCRVNILTAVAQGNTMLQHPYSRCYIVESRSPTGAVLRTSGYAISAWRVITSVVHYGAQSIKVSRSYVLGPPSGPHTTAFDSQPANAIRTWNQGSRDANIGLRYAILGMAQPLSIRDSAGDRTWFTITGALAFSPRPDLILLTRRVPSGELVRGVSTEAPRRITTGSVAEWYSTHLGGYIGRGSDDYMLGSPIFVTQQTIPITGGGPVITKHLLVGIVTDEVVASDPCTVNAGLFLEDGAVQRLLDSF